MTKTAAPDLGVRAAVRLYGDQASTFRYGSSSITPATGQALAGIGARVNAEIDDFLKMWDWENKRRHGLRPVDRARFEEMTAFMAAPVPVAPTLGVVAAVKTHGDKAWLYSRYWAPKVSVQTSMACSGREGTARVEDRDSFRMKMCEEAGRLFQEWTP